MRTRVHRRSAVAVSRAAAVMSGDPVASLDRHSLTSRGQLVSQEVFLMLCSTCRARCVRCCAAGWLTWMRSVAACTQQHLLHPRVHLRRGRGAADPADLQFTEAKVAVPREPAAAELGRIPASQDHRWRTSAQRTSVSGGRCVLLADWQPSSSQWLEGLVDKIAQFDVFGGRRANHVLVNEYLPGQGILVSDLTSECSSYLTATHADQPHEDGPVFFPTITTVSLESHTILQLSPKPTEASQDCPIVSLLLEPRSLLVIRDDAYTGYLHGIQEVETDVLDESVCNLHACKGRSLGDVLRRGRRVSCTIRFVSNMRTGLMDLIRKVS